MIFSDYLIGNDHINILKEDNQKKQAKQREIRQDKNQQ
jgi:hypothetical protein